MNRLDQQAMQYIEEFGTPLERWRVRRYSGITEELPCHWAAQQTPKGGWRSKESDANSSEHIGTTVLNLLDFAFIGFAKTPECQSTVDYLWSIQLETGCWTENPELLLERDLPDYNQPGDVKVDLWLTANALAALAALGYTQDPRVTRGVEWVLAREESDLDILFPGFHHTLFAMASVQWMRGEKEGAERYLQRILEHFHKNRREAWYDLMDLTWALKLMSVADIPKDHPTVEALLRELQGRRQANGIWRSIYGWHESMTLEAMEILQGYGVVGDE